MSATIIKRSNFVLDLCAPYRVRASDAFVDRIELTIGDWGLFGSEGEVLSQLHGLRDVEVFDCNGEVLRLFHRFEAERLAGKFDIRFSASKSDDANSGRSPLIAGRLEKSGRYRRYEALEGAALQFCFASTLNLTRWVQAQSLRRITRLDRPRICSEYVMAIAPDTGWHDNEQPLVPSSNIVIGGAKRYGYAKGYPLERHLANYLRATSRLLGRSIAALPFDGHEPPRRARFYSLREIEFYWEFDHESPIQYVWSIVGTALAQSQRGYLGSATTSQTSAEVQWQSPSLKLMLSKGVWLRIYAKTNRRVRFEVVLEKKAIEKCIGRRSGSNLRSVTDTLEPLRALATEKLNEVFPSINDNVPAKSSATSLLLISEIQRACNNPHMAEAVLGALVAFGRIAPYNNDPMRDSVDRLKKAGVLRPVKPRSRVCVVSERYQESLSFLRQALNSC